MLVGWLSGFSVGFVVGGLGGVSFDVAFWVYWLARVVIFWVCFAVFSWFVVGGLVPGLLSLLWGWYNMALCRLLLV